MLKRMKRRSKRERHITFEYTGDNEEDIPNNVTHVRVLHGVTKIKRVAFHAGVKRTSRLQSISFSSTVVEIGQEAFMFCDSLRELVFNEGLKIIGSRAFCGCGGVESLFKC